jgi:phosphatidylglycerol---prolipoprotein diacylglyceryl transferase
MNLHASLAFLYWNPTREAFTIPFIDLSIVWYGIIFATGFVVGYFLLIPIFKEYLWRNRTLFERDISSWSLLIAQLKKSNEPSSMLFPALCDQLNTLPTNSPPSNSLKHAILSFLNSKLQAPSRSLNRKSLEDLFPGGIAKAQVLSVLFVDRLTWFIVIGTIVGARLGHVFFYDWPYFQNHLLEIVMIRNGGLASHGGTIGVLIAVWLFLYSNRSKFPELSFISLLDLLCIPTAFVVTCIRIGNFFNQEILGIQTTVPWAVVFGQPADGSLPFPRHAVQLYEAIAYLGVFFLLLTLWKKFPELKKGTLSSIFFILVFGSRFLIEFLKMPQSMLIDESSIQMGQYLSIPFILLGIFFMILPQNKFKMI